MKDGEVDLVFNTTEGSAAVEDSRSMRAVCLNDKIPYYTTAAAAQAAVLAMRERVEGEIKVRALQDKAAPAPQNLGLCGHIYLP